MSETAVAKFACTNCGKTYTWKPQFAGKKLKCSCGQLMQAPASLDSPPPAPEPNPDNLYDVGPEPTKPKPQKKEAPPAAGPPCPACGEKLPELTSTFCVHCGHNLKTGKKIRTSVAAAPAAHPAHAAPHPAPAEPADEAPASNAPVVGYFGTRPKSDNDEPEPGFFSQPNTREFYIPIALMVAGLALSVLVGLRARSATAIATALTEVGIDMTIDLVLILGSIFLTARLMGLSFGAFGPAILKICAISLLPGALGVALFLYVPGGLFIGWATSLLLYLGLFMYLFDLDLGETLICVAIIWLVRNWAGTFIAAFLWGILRGG